MAAIIQIDGWDPSAAAGDGAPVTFRLSSHDDDTVCHLNSEVWYPVIERLPTLRYDLFSGAFDGKLTTPASNFRFSIEPWPALPGWWLADARVRIWTGQPGAAWIDWTLRFDGRATAQPEIDNGFATLTFAVDDRWLDGPVLATYAGTGGAEGEAALKGTPKPLALGAPRYASGTLIDPTNVIVQLSAYGAVEEFEVAMDRLSRFGASAGDYASYAALAAASVPAGRWATAEAVGMVRHGAPPSGKLSYLLKGDKAGTDGWARLPGDIIRRVGLIAGGTGKIDDLSLDALNLSRPWNLSLMVTEQTSARDLAQRIAASINAVAGVSFTGKLFVAPAMVSGGSGTVLLTGGGDPLLGDAEYLVASADPGATGLTLNADGSTFPIVRSVRQIETSAPWWRLDLGAEPTWEVHSPEEIAFTATLLDRGDYSGTETYREGNIVRDQSSSWLYINPAPSAGNAPPTLPTTSNSYWTIFAGQGVAGASAKTLVVGSDRQVIFYDAAGAASPSTQTTTFTASKQNTTATVSWSVTDADGTPRTPVTSYLSAATGNSVTMSEAQFAAARNGTSGVIVTGSLTDGATITDRINVVRVQAGATGSPGSAGRDAVVFYQDTTPSSPVVGDTWVTVTGKLWRRWNGSAWVQLLGDLSTLSIIADQAYLADALIGSAKIANLAVTRLKIGNYEVDATKIEVGATTILSAYASASGVTANTSASWTQVASVTVTDSDGRDIFLTFTAHCINQTDDYANLMCRIRCSDGTYVYGGSGGKQVWVTDEGTTLTITAKDTVSAGADPTYYVEVINVNSGSSSGTENVDITEVTFIAQEARN